MDRIQSPSDKTFKQILPIVHHLRLTDYHTVWHNMKTFTLHRGAKTRDQLWITQHYPVFTLGIAGKLEHLRASHTGIPYVWSDRGGQITYHAPGQIVAYTLINLKRYGIGIKKWVHALEQAVINLMAEFSIRGERISGRPGVYVAGEKIASLGLRIKRGCCYHGVALNVDMDLSPFRWINPCGYTDVSVTSIAHCMDTLMYDSPIPGRLTHYCWGQKLASHINHMLLKHHHDLKTR